MKNVECRMNNGGWKMKMAAFFAFAIAATVAAAYDDVQITYRGHLKENGLTPSEQTVKMVFRLYGDIKSTTASWSTTNDAVRINSQGLFQVALRGEGLAEAIDSGKANWIGVSIADGKEQYPRQALLAAARAEKAAVATGLSDSPSVGTVTARSVVADSLSVSGPLDIGGKVSAPSAASSAAAVSMEAKLAAAWYTLEMKGKVRFFAAGEPQDLGTRTASGGGCSFSSAECNCVALFTAENSDIMPGMSQFVKKGKRIEISSNANLPDGTTVRCRVYPIGVE